MPARAAACDGNERDFLVGIDDAFTGQLGWQPSPVHLSSWDPFEPISFFFVSNLPPGEGPTETYGLHTFWLRPNDGRAQGLAPIPEPGSIALVGSGLVGLYAALRRRRSQEDSGRDQIRLPRDGRPSRQTNAR
jgi:hypothetical protein